MVSVAQAGLCWSPQMCNEDWMGKHWLHTPCTTLDTFTSVISPNPRKTHFHPHFSVGETEAQRGRGTFPGSHCAGVVLDSNLEALESSPGPWGMSASTHQGSSLTLDPGPGGKSRDPLIGITRAPSHCGHRGAAASRPSLCSGSPTSAPRGAQRQPAGEPRLPRARHRRRSLQLCLIYTESFKKYNWLLEFKNQKISYPNPDF